MSVKTLQYFFSLALGLFIAPVTFAGVLDGPALNYTLAQPRIRIASTWGGANQTTVTLSNGTTQVSGTERFKWLANTDVKNLQMVLINSYMTAASITNYVGNGITFHAVQELPSGNLGDFSFGPTNISPISTGGRPGTNIGDGQMLVSLPLVNSIMTAGSVQTSRIYKTVGAGQFWPMTYSTGNVWANQGITTTDFVFAATNNNGSDQSTIFSQTTGAITTGSYFWGPVAYLAEQITPVPVVEISGDSISYGFGGYVGQGYVGKALANANIAWHNDGVNGTTCQALSRYAQVAQYLSQFADYEILHCMTNDIWQSTVTTLSQAQAEYVSLAQSFAHKGKTRLYLSTILPRTTSSDSWATYPNQTLGGSFETLRVQINNWLRDRSPSGAVAYLQSVVQNGTVIGVFDETPGVERNLDGSAVVLSSNGQQTGGTGGYWLTNGSASFTTADGIHPNQHASDLLAPYVPVAQFVLY